MHAPIINKRQSWDTCSGEKNRNVEHAKSNQYSTLLLTPLAMPNISEFSDLFSEPLARYVNLRFTHAPGKPGTFPQPWCTTRSLTSGFLWSQWREKRSRHSRHMHNAQFYVSGTALCWQWQRLLWRQDIDACYIALWITQQTRSITLGVLLLAVRFQIEFCFQQSIIRKFFNPLRPGQDDCHFGIFKCIFANENVLIAKNISQKFVPTAPADNNSLWLR